ncbi:MAG: YdcF family protein [Myxococcota bacterium]
MAFVLLLAAFPLVLRALGPALRGEAWPGNRGGSQGRLVARGLLVAHVLALGWTAPRAGLLVKTLGLLAMPLGLVWTSLGAWALWRVVSRRPVAPALVPFLALSVAGSAPLGDAALRALEGPHGQAAPLDTAAPDDTAAPFDAVIVLGGGTSETTRGEAQLGSSGDRVLLGARLYRRGRTARLVTSGSPTPGFSTHDAARATRRIWRELGVPEAHIVLVDGARNTREEARLHTARVRAEGWQRVGLVTSAWHLPRALRAFREAGLPEVVPLPADVRGAPFALRGLHDLIPTGDGAAALKVALWELLGRAAGR